MRTRAWAFKYIVVVDAALQSSYFLCYQSFGELWDGMEGAGSGLGGTHPRLAPTLACNVTLLGEGALLAWN